MNDPAFTDRITANRLTLFVPRHELRAIVLAALPDGYHHLPIVDYICSRLAVAYPDSLPPPDAVAFAIKRVFVECGDWHRRRAAEEIPASLHESGLFTQVLFATAAEYPTADPPAGTVEAIARRVFEFFRTDHLTRLAGAVLGRRQGFGVGRVELAGRATTQLFLMSKKNFFAPGRASFETWLIRMVLRPALTCLLREDRNIRQVIRSEENEDGLGTERYFYRVPVPLPAERLDTTDPVAAVDDRELLVRYLGGLTLDHREVIGLRDLLGVSWPDISVLCDPCRPLPRCVRVRPPGDRPDADELAVNRMQARRSHGLDQVRRRFEQEEGA